MSVCSYEKTEAGKHIWTINSGRWYDFRGQIIFCMQVSKGTFFMMDVCRDLDYYLEGDLDTLEDTLKVSEYVMDAYDNRKFSTTPPIRSERVANSEVLTAYAKSKLLKNIY